MDRKRKPSVKCEIDGKQCQINWRDRYIVIDKVKAGKTVSVTFPISERTVTEKVGGVVYAFIHYKRQYRSFH